MADVAIKNLKSGAIEISSLKERSALRNIKESTVEQSAEESKTEKNSLYQI